MQEEDCLDTGGEKENDICHFIIMTPHTNIVFFLILQSM
ncbi:hypothetical protein B4143_3964 [Bacillus subtilis]|nr:hypothetical protein B4143_3964 [Bacillus subtilis]